MKAKQFAESKKPFAFVIMPFSNARPINNGYPNLNKDALDTIYAVIRSCLTRKGYKVRRAESPTDILRDIVLDLDKADLVVADVTALNPNVMYELGIRHGFCKKTILITQDRSELPFDIAGYQCLEYGWVTEKEKKNFQANIGNLLSQLDSHPDPRYGPVHTHIGTRSLALHEEEHRQTVRRLRALCEELSWLMMTFNLALTDFKQLYPEAVKGDFAAWKINDDKLSSEAVAQMMSRLLIPPLPAADAFLALSYVNDAYDAFGEVTILTRELLTLKHASAMISPMRSNYFSFLCDLVGTTERHALQVTTAVRHSRVNERIFEMKIDDDLQFDSAKYEVVQETYRRQKAQRRD
jgi:hypothetical protein